jgi:hypothetical protein
MAFLKEYRRIFFQSYGVIPAKAGIQSFFNSFWTPAFAGVTPSLNFSASFCRFLSQKGDLERYGCFFPKAKVRFFTIHNQRSSAFICVPLSLQPFAPKEAGK